MIKNFFVGFNGSWRMTPSQLQMRKFPCLTWIIFSSILQVTALTDGDCRSMVIAVPDRVREANLTATDLHDIFTEFFFEVSQYMSAILDTKYSLIEIKVLLPNSWQDTDVEIEIATSKTYLYQTADVRLDIFNPLPQNGNLYTVHSRGHGEGGEFTYIHPEFFQTWNKTRDKLMVLQFVQEWLKLSIGEFRKIDFADDISKTTPSTEISDSSIPVLPVHSTLSVEDINKYRNLRCTSRNSWTIPTSKRKSIIPSIKFVKTRLNAIIVIDLDLCRVIMNKENHWAAFALRKFIKDFPENGLIGVVILNERTSTLSLSEKNDWNDYYERIFNLTQRDKCENENYLKAIEKAVEMTALSEAHVVLMSPLYGVFTHLPSSLRHDNRNWVINLQNNPSTIDKCNSTMIFRVEEQFHNFFNKYAIEDFYPKTIKIAEFISHSSDQPDKITVPFSPVTVMYNVHKCDLNADNLTEELSFSKTWTNTLLTSNKAIQFSPNISMIDVIGWSVWIERSSNPIKTTLDVYIDINQTRGGLVIMYALNPNDYNLTMTTLPISTSSYAFSHWNDGFNQLQDNGIDPDNLAGDKIYSGYINTDKLLDKLIFQVELLAKDSNFNVVARINTGPIIPEAASIREDLHDKIDDLDVIINNNSTVNFTWTVPNVYYIGARVSAYKLRCNKEITGIFTNPHVRGTKEYYSWQRPYQNISYNCALASMSPNGLWSEWSNVVAIYPTDEISTITNIEVMQTSTTETNSSVNLTFNTQKFHFGKEEIFIVVLVLLVILFALGLIAYHRSLIGLSSIPSRLSVQYRADFIRQSPIPVGNSNVYRPTTIPRRQNTKRWNSSAIPKMTNSVDYDQTEALLNNSNDRLFSIEHSASEFSRSDVDRPNSAVFSPQQQFNPKLTYRKSNSNLPLSSMYKLPTRVSQFASSPTSDADSYPTPVSFPEKSVSPLTAACVDEGKNEHVPKDK